MPGEGLLMVMTDVDAEVEIEFNRWYDERHIPNMLSVPGVLNARRFRALQGKPNYLALYELRDTTVVARPEFRRVSALYPEADPRTREMFSNFRNPVRGVYRQILTLPQPEPQDLSGAKVLMLRALESDPEHEEEFNDWYNTEHVPNLTRVAGCLRGRRFKLDGEVPNPLGKPSLYIAYYDLASVEVLSSEAWREGVETPWTKRIRRHYIDRLRNVYERMF